jgi:exodeoxyribonuclease V
VQAFWAVSTGGAAGGEIMDLSPDQLRVHDAVLDWLCRPTDLLTIGGLGGSGKTTLLSELAKHFPTPTAYITPTGRATSVLARKLAAGGTHITKLQRPPDGKPIGRKWRHLFDASLPSDGGPPLCTTYHRLLLRPVVDPQTEELLGWKERLDLDRAYGLICLDEGSMISDRMLGILQARGVPVLAVGDHGQLSPVKDSGSLMQNPMLRLEQIHRQLEGSSIIALAHHVRGGGRLRDFKGWDENCVLRSRSEEEAVVRETLAEPSRLDVTFIAWANKTRVRINRLARQLQGYEGPPVPGEPIVALHNYGNVCNGMRGLLAQPSFFDERRDWILHANVEFPDDMMAGDWHEMNAYQFNRVYPFANLDELRQIGIPAETISGGGRLFDFGYCLTCHKAQGSQFSHAVVIVDRAERPSEDDWRRWIYTSATRAQTKLTIIAG